MGHGIQMAAVAVLSRTSVLLSQHQATPVSTPTPGPGAWGPGPSPPDIIVFPDEGHLMYVYV